MDSRTGGIVYVSGIRDRSLAQGDVAMTAIDVSEVKTDADQVVVRVPVTATLVYMNGNKLVVEYIHPAMGGKTVSS